MRARTLALALAAALTVTVVVLADRAVLLLRSGTLVGVVLGLAVLVLPIAGVGILVAELRFGRDSERLGRILDTEGGLPAAPPGSRPSGRVDRSAADAAFDRYRLAAEAAPDDWRVWFRLAVAYGDAGDVRRGRAAMRRAVALERRGGPAPADRPWDVD